MTIIAGIKMKKDKLIQEIGIKSILMKWKITLIW